MESRHPTLACVCDLGGESRFKGALDEEKERLLDKLGFNWRAGQKHTSLWYARFEQVSKPDCMSPVCTVLEIAEREFPQESE